MRIRLLWSGLSAASAAALVSVMVAPLSGQSAPRTPWGDPDIQGTYENGTPLETPDEFAGRTLDQVTGEELANMRRAIQKRTIGAFLGPEHAPDNLTERFQRMAPDEVRWTVTVDDPTTWTKPWTFSLPLTADPNPMPHDECHEGNYGLKNILSAARAEERQK